MSEQQPLLSRPSQNDVENGEQTESQSTLTAWHEKTAEFLESPRLHKFVISLIVIDAVCVLVDLSYTFLSGSCGPEAIESPMWLEILGHISLAITTFFLIEIPLDLWAFGLSYYNPLSENHVHASLHIFDAIVIMVTFAFEVFLRGRERELASLLIILRLWRLVKLVGGIAVGAGEIEEETAKQLEESKKKISELKTELSKAEAENVELKAKIVALQGVTSPA